MEKLKPTQEMLEYIDADGLEKQGKAQKDKLRPNIIEQLKMGEYEGISYSQRKSLKIKDKDFYNWVKETWPEKLNTLLKEEICPMKFESAYLTGNIQYDEIPPYVYEEKAIDVIDIAKNKKGVKNENNS